MFVVKVDGWTEREIESRALRLATLVRRAWRAVSRDLYAALSAKKTVTERDLELLPKSWQQHADELVLGYITDTFVDSAGHIAAALDAPDGELIGDDIVDTFVNVARKRVRSMSDDVWDAVRAQLVEGIQKGESVAEIAARVRDTAGVTTPKALTIARTEVHAAHEAGSFEQALYVDPRARKEWLATKDERTRPSHRAAAGQSRRIGDTFTVGGTTLRFPGDPLGDAGEVINCRCTSTYIFDMIDSVSDASTSDDALIAAFDPKSHPRGRDGRFIKKGSALFNLLTAVSDEDFAKALSGLSKNDYKNITLKQFEDVVGRINDINDKMPGDDLGIPDVVVPKKIKSSAGVKLSPAVAGSEPGSVMKMSTTVIWAANPHNAVIAESKTGDERVVWDGNAKKYKLQTGHPPTGEWTDVESFSKKGAYEKFKGDNKWVVPNPDNHVDLAALDNEPDVPSIPQQVKPATLDTPNIAPVDVAPVPDVGSKPDVAPSQATTGTPVKVTTGVIWGKYEAGTPILESSDGKSQVVWNGKKYEVQSRLDDGTWQTKSEMTKKDAYAKLKGDTSWVTPSPQDSSEPVAGITPSAPDVPVDTTPNVPEPSIQKTNIADIGVDTKPNAPRVMDGSDIKPSDVLFDIQPSNVKFDVDEALFDYYGGDMWTGDVVAVSPSGDAYLEVIPDGFALMTQYPDGSSSLHKKYTGYNQLESAVADYPQIGETWVKPKTEQSNNAPTVDFTPSKTSVQPTPTPQSNHITHSTDLLSQDKAVSSVPHYAKVWLKKKMKSANVGYWSKPEKIFEQITDLQIKDPQYAKFTQMQIIVALDQQTNVKATTTPYLDKMTKWANTSGGKSKIAELIGKLNYMTMPDEPTAPGDLGKSSVDKVQYSAKAYLQNFFTQANVPPTSKPEDIWDTIVKAQAFPTYQKMSVATILDVLDDNSPYKTSFKDKISAWVGTKEGKAYIDAVSTQHVNLPSTKTSIPTPPSTSPILSVPKATNTGGDPLPPLKVMGSGEIDYLSPDVKSNVYTAFKNHPSTYVDSPPLSLFNAAKKTAEQHQLDIMQVLRAVDEFGANKFKVQNSKLFEKKVVDWLGKPQGAAVSQGKPVPKPPTPKFINGIDPNVLIPSFEESSGLEYKEVMPYDAVGWFQKAKDKYGEWTTAQKNGLKTWTGGTYMTINHYLWGKSTDASQSTLDTLKHAQAGMRPSLEPILLHRGQNFTGIGNAKNHDDLMKMVGQTWKADGFMATSVGGNATFGGNVRLDIEAPPGTPMAYVSHISYFKGENEMLLAAGLSYRIISVKQMNGTSVVRVRIVPEPVEQGDAA